jgi:hypothetical protein
LSLPPGKARLRRRMGAVSVVVDKLDDYPDSSLPS